MSIDLNKEDPHATDDDMHPMAKVLFGWVGAPLTGRIIFWGLGLLALILLAVDPLMHRHVKADIEGYFGFYGIYGFVAFAFVVLMGWPLGRLLRRPENYYGDIDDADDEETRS